MRAHTGFYRAYTTMQKRDLFHHFPRFSVSIQSSRKQRGSRGRNNGDDIQDAVDRQNGSDTVRRGLNRSLQEWPKASDVKVHITISLALRSEPHWTWESSMFPLIDPHVYRCICYGQSCPRLDDSATRACVNYDGYTRVTQQNYEMIVHAPPNFHTGKCSISVSSCDRVCDLISWKFWGAVWILLRSSSKPKNGIS
jgi:hypothetical protein